MTIDESASFANKKPTSPTKSSEETVLPTEQATTTVAAEEENKAPELESTVETDSTTQTSSVTANDVPTIDEESALEPEPTPTREELIRQLTKATQKAENHWDSLLRKQAEYDNLQKRMTRDLDNARKYALEKFATELLAVKDSMELGLDAAVQSETGLEAVREGMVLTLKMLTDAMAKFGIVEINPVEEKFDPQWHEAMAMQPVPNVEDGMVLHVHQKGYQLNNRLLRPARVIVAKAPIEVEKPLEK